MKLSGLMAVVLLAPAAFGQDVMSGLKACRAQTDATARLACFDALVSRLDAPAVVSAPRTPPAVQTAAPPDFGGENLSRADTPKSQESMTVGVTKFSFNAIQHFTVILDNGQVWRQSDSDTQVARFDADKANVVTVSKGFLDAYTLAIEGRHGIFKVKRIK